MYKPNFIYHKNMNSLVLLEKHMPEEKRIINGGAAAAAAAVFLLGWLETASFTT
jgi:hypothetical protein